MSEDQASFVYALLDGKPDRKRRTWKENKVFKAEARKDRGSFVKGSGAEAPRGASGGPPGVRATPQAPFRGRFRGNRPRLSREQMKKVSRCRLCDQKGHWAEDCPNARPSAGTRSGPAPRPTGPGHFTKTDGFCYLGSTSGQGNLFGVSSSYMMTFARGAPLVDEAILEGRWSFLTLTSGSAILDIGATQDIIGECALKALEHSLDLAGLKTVEIPTSAAVPSGIGGQAKVVKTVLVPISPGGAPGVVSFLVIENNVPPLLSVGLLEHLGASISLVTNEVHFESIGITMKMEKESSGHRTIQLVQWDGSFFPVPETARQQFGLTSDAFIRTRRIARLPPGTQSVMGLLLVLFWDRQRQQFGQASLGHVR